MVGKWMPARAALLAAALVLGAGVAQAQAQDEQRLVMVHNDNPAQIEALENGGVYDVGYIAADTEAAVYLDSTGEALLRAQGFTIGQVVSTQADYENRRAEIARTDAAEAVAADVAKNGLTKAAKAKGAVNVPGHVVIQRAYTFTNYAGRFLYVEARNDLHTDTTGPAMSFTYTTPAGTSAAVNLSNSSISPDGNDAAIGGNKLADSDAGAGFRYMYHRGLIALQGANASVAAADVSVRVADANGNFDTAGVTEWANKTLPARVTAYQKDFISKYMDPTEINTRLDGLVAQYPNIMQSIDLPNKTGGYQRQGMAMMVGNIAATGTPSAAQAPQAVYLLSKAMGQNGGNNITAEFRAPAAGTLNAPLSITVTDGTWRTHDPADADASNGISEITIPTKDIVVNLATDAAGALSTTAAQLVAALNADAAAGALVTASTYAGNAGAGIVPATVARTYQVVDGTTNGPNFSSSKVKLSDYLRGGTAYWTGSFPTTAVPAGTLVRTDARHITKGPFNQKVYRITNSANRAAGKTGIFIYCEQHAREWVGGITCLETAQRLVTNYATDPTTKNYVDNLDVFILPVVNPDGTHYSFYDNSVQRRNLTNYCSPTTRQLLRGQPRFLGRRPQPQQRDRLDLRRLLRREQLVHQRHVLGPVGGLRAGDQERALDRRHVPEDQVRHEPAHPRRLLHVGAGRVHLGRPQDPAGAEHRHREVLLPGLRRRAVGHQVLAQHGDPAAAHGPDRRRALLGRRQLGGRHVLPQGHHRLLVRGRRPAHVRQPDNRRDHPPAGRLPAVLRRARHPGRPGLGVRDDLRHAARHRAQPAAGQRGPRRGHGVRRGRPRPDPGRARVLAGHHAGADDDPVLVRADQR